MDIYAECETTVKSIGGKNIDAVNFKPPNGCKVHVIGINSGLVRMKVSGPGYFSLSGYGLPWVGGKVEAYARWGLGDPE